MGLYDITIAGHSFWMEQEADFVVKALQNGEPWETTALNLWAEACEGVEGTIIDVGAYTGIYSLLAAKVALKASIEAFEPLTQVFNRLKDNVLTNNLQTRIRLHNSALSNTNSPGIIHITGKSPLPSGSSVDPHPVFHDIAIFPILMQTGDSLFEKENVRLIKMDVERHEHSVLLGFQKTLKYSRPICFIEILDKQALGTIMPIMQSLGYPTAELICEDLKSTVTDNRLLEPMKDRTNYIFRPSI